MILYAPSATSNTHFEKGVIKLNSANTDSSQQILEKYSFSNAIAASGMHVQLT